MKKSFVMLLLAVSLVGCGSGTTTNQGTEHVQETSVEEVTPTESDTPQEEAIVEDGVIGGKYKVEFGSAEKATSQYEEGNLLMVTYTFTNNSEETVAADTALILKAFQDGIEVEQAFDVELTGENASKSIRPGASLECKALFKLTSSSDLEVEAAEFLGFDDSVVTKTYTIQ